MKKITAHLSNDSCRIAMMPSTSIVRIGGTGLQWKVDICWLFLGSLCSSFWKLETAKNIEFNMVDKEVEKSELPKHLILATYTKIPSFQAGWQRLSQTTSHYTDDFSGAQILHIDFVPTLPNSKNITCESKCSIQQSHVMAQEIYTGNLQKLQEFMHMSNMSLFKMANFLSYFPGYFQIMDDFYQRYLGGLQIHLDRSWEGDNKNAGFVVFFHVAMATENEDGVWLHVYVEHIYAC